MLLNKLQTLKLVFDLLVISGPQVEIVPLTSQVCYFLGQALDLVAELPKLDLLCAHDIFCLLVA